jgi:hypothetical protein
LPVNTTPLKPKYYFSPKLIIKLEISKTRSNK